MDIAIHYEKINLDDDKCIFKPINVIRGTYNKDSNMFTTESGIVCYPTTSNQIYENDYFSSPTTIDELRDTYGEALKDMDDGEVSDEALITEFFDICMENVYVGFYDDYTKTRVVPIPVYELDDVSSLNKEENSDETLYTLDESSLKDLRDSKSLIEIRSKINTLLSIAEGAKNGTLAEMVEEKPKKYKLKKEESKINLGKIRKEVLSQIISQDQAVKALTTTIVVNANSKNPKHKSHILIAGPTGTGKSEMVNIICKYLDMPCFCADATAYTKEGYVGKSVYSMLTGLVDAAEGDIEKAQNGILVIDEIDKKAFGGNDDVGGKTVLHSLFKMMDRNVVEMNKSYNGVSSFDTSNLTIIFMGAFEEMFRLKKKSKKNKIGFSEETEESESFEVNNQDFVDFGMPAEFMGRIGEVTYTKEFKELDLLKILKQSKISPIKMEREYFKDLGIKVTFSKSYLEEIAKKSIKSGTGARDLKKLVHESLTYAYDEPFLNEGVKVMKFTKDTVNNPKNYYAK